MSLKRHVGPSAVLGGAPDIALLAVTDRDDHLSGRVDIDFFQNGIADVFVDGVERPLDFDEPEIVGNEEAVVGRVLDDSIEIVCISGLICVPVVSSGDDSANTSPCGAMTGR